MRQGTSLNFSAIPQTRGQVQPGPIVAGDGAQVSDHESRLAALEAEAASPQSITLAQSGVLIAHTGTLAETTLVTVTIPGGTIGPNGRVEIYAAWSATANGNSKLGRVKIGGSLIGVWGPGSDASCSGTITITNRGTEGQQVAFVMGTAFQSGNAIFTAAIDTSADADITITSDLDVGTDHFDLEAYSVRVFPA